MPNNKFIFGIAVVSASLFIAYKVYQSTKERGVKSENEGGASDHDSKEVPVAQPQVVVDKKKNDGGVSVDEARTKELQQLVVGFIVNGARMGKLAKELRAVVASGATSDAAARILELKASIAGMNEKNREIVTSISQRFQAKGLRALEEALMKSGVMETVEEDQRLAAASSSQRAGTEDDSQLVHHLMTNPNARLQKRELSEMESAVSSTLHRAFWDRFAEDLAAGKFDMAVGLLGEVKTKLAALAPRSESLRRALEERLDTQLLQQMFDARAVDQPQLRRLVHFILDQISLLHSPARDEALNRWKGTTLAEIEMLPMDQFLARLPEVFEFIFERLEETHIDLVNFRLQQAQPLMQQYGPEYQRRALAKDLSSGRTSLSRTVSLLRTSTGGSGASASGASAAAVGAAGVDDGSSTVAVAAASTAVEVAEGEVKAAEDALGAARVALAVLHSGDGCDVTDILPAVRSGGATAGAGAGADGDGVSALLSLTSDASAASLRYAIALLLFPSANGVYAEEESGAESGVDASNHVPSLLLYGLPLAEFVPETLRLEVEVLEQARLRLRVAMAVGVLLLALRMELAKCGVRWGVGDSGASKLKDAAVLLRGLLLRPDEARGSAGTEDGTVVVSRTSAPDALTVGKRVVLMARDIAAAETEASSSSNVGATYHPSTAVPVTSLAPPLSGEGSEDRLLAVVREHLCFSSTPSTPDYLLPLVRKRLWSALRPAITRGALDQPATEQLLAPAGLGCLAGDVVQVAGTLLEVTGRGVGVYATVYNSLLRDAVEAGGWTTTG